jgi:hypothetical protein
VIGDRDNFPFGEGLFFAIVGTLILWLFDAYKPLADVRFARSERGRAHGRRNDAAGASVQE